MPGGEKLIMSNFSVRIQDSCGVTIQSALERRSLGLCLILGTQR